MGSNIRDFDLGLKQFGLEIPVEVEKVHRAVALEGLRGLVLMTPVREGRARGNWQASDGTPATGETGVLDKSGGLTINAALAFIGKIKAFSITYLANNVPYIEKLENGSSKQAPKGMLAVTYNRLVNWLRQR